MREMQYPVDELTIRDSWRMFQILAEFVEGFEVMSEVHPAVTIFGSSRTEPDSPVYQATEDLAGQLVENGFNVISGGGPGVMEG